MSSRYDLGIRHWHGPTCSSGPENSPFVAHRTLLPVRSQRPPLDDLGCSISGHADPRRKFADQAGLIIQESDLPAIPESSDVSFRNCDTRAVPAMSRVVDRASPAVMPTPSAGRCVVPHRWRSDSPRPAGKARRRASEERAKLVAFPQDRQRCLPIRFKRSAWKAAEKARPSGQDRNTPTTDRQAGARPHERPRQRSCGRASDRKIEARRRRRATSPASPS